MSRRGLALAAVLAAAGLAASACQALPGAAAFVGGQRISDSQLADQVHLALRDPTIAQRQASQPGSVVRTVLGILINDRVVTAAAARLRVDVSDAAVRARLAALAAQAGGAAALLVDAANAGIPPSEVFTYVHDAMLEAAMAQRLTADIPVSLDQLKALYLANDVQVHVAHILVGSQALARRLLVAVRTNPARFAGLARRYSIDTGSRANGGDLGIQAPSAYVAPFAAAVSTAPVGSFVLVHSQFGWHVVHIIARTTAESFAAAEPALRARVLAGQAQARLTAELRKVSNELGVTVSPRYGRWDPAAGQVVTAASLSTPAPRQPPDTGAAGLP